MLDTARLHARLGVHRRRVEQALTMLDTRIPSDATAVVAYSGGKDSTVIAHLAAQVRPVVLVHIDSGIDLPETHQHTAALHDRFGWPTVSIVKDSVDVMVRHGGWDFAAPDGAAQVAHDIDTWYSEIHVYARHVGGDVFVWGLRADESAMRRAMLSSTRGVRHRRDGLTTVAPCWNWATIDIWAYHLAHHLPVNPVYQRLSDLGCPETSWRVDAAVSGARGKEFGRYVWLRRGWPDLYAQLERRLPRLGEMS